MHDRGWRSRWLSRLTTQLRTLIKVILAKLLDGGVAPLIPISRVSQVVTFPPAVTNLETVVSCDCQVGVLQNHVLLFIVLVKH